MPKSVILLGQVSISSIPCPAEERNEEGDGEVHTNAVVDGKGDELTAAGCGDDRKGGVAAGGSALADRRKRAEQTAKEGGTEDDKQFAEDVVEQGEGAQSGTAQLRDEDAGKRIVAETGADSQPVAHAIAREEEGHGRSANPCGKDGDHGQGHQPFVHPPQLMAHFVVLPYAEPHAGQQEAQGTETGLRGQETAPIPIPGHAAEDKEAHDDQAVAHLDTKGHGSVLLPAVGRQARLFPPPQRPPAECGREDGYERGAHSQNESFRAQPPHAPQHVRVASHFLSHEEQQEPHEHGSGPADAAHRMPPQEVAGRHAEPQDKKDEKRLHGFFCKATKKRRVKHPGRKVLRK